MKPHRMRADSNGNFHRNLQAQLGVSNSATSSNINPQITYGEQAPFNQNIIVSNQPTPFYQPSFGLGGNGGNESILGTTHSVVSASHPSSSQQLNSNSNNLLHTMEPFSTQHISQSAQSIIHSNLPSRKGSVHTDDSLTGSPQNLTNQHNQIFGTLSGFHDYSQYLPHYNMGGTAAAAAGYNLQPPIPTSLSVFSRQSTTRFKSHYGQIGAQTHTATASIACNEGGPIGLREYSHANRQQHNKYGGGFRPKHHPSNAAQSEAEQRAYMNAAIKSQEEEEIEFKDPILDKVRVPQVQVNNQAIYQALVKDLRNIINNEKKDKQSSPIEQQNNGKVLQQKNESPISPPQIAVNNELQTSQFSSGAGTQSNSTTVILTQSIQSANLSSGTSQIFQKDEKIVHPQPVASLSNHDLHSQLQSQQQLQPTETYQSLNFKESIWSPHVLPQTEEEFLYQQSQITQQHQESQIEIDASQITLPTTIPQQQQQQQQTQLNLSSNSQPYIPLSQNNAATSIQYEGNSNANTPTGQSQIYQNMQMVNWHNVGASGGAQNQQQIPTGIQSQTNNANIGGIQTYSGGQGGYSQQEVQAHQIIVQTAANQDQQTANGLNEVQQIALNQIINQQLNHSHPQNIVAQLQQIAIQHPHHLRGSPQIQGSQQELSQKEIRDAAAQAEAMHQLMAQGQLQAQYFQHQFEQFHHANPQLQHPTPIYKPNSHIASENHAELLPGTLGGGGLLESQMNYQNDMKIQHFYMARQFNRFMRSSIYKTKLEGPGHSYQMQGSFRADQGSQSPDLIFPNNLSVIRPPPGFEHIIPKNLLQLQQFQSQQYGCEIEDEQLILQKQYNQLLYHQALQGMASYQQQQNEAAANQAAVQQQIQQQILQQQQQQQIQTEEFQQQHLQHPQMRNANQIGNHNNQGGGGNAYEQHSNFGGPANSANKFFLNYGILPQNQIYSRFYESQISKQTELDEQLRQTTQQLDYKLMENLEIEERISVEEQNLLQNDDTTSATTAIQQFQGQKQTNVQATQESFSTNSNHQSIQQMNTLIQQQYAAAPNIRLTNEQSDYLKNQTMIMMQQQQQQVQTISSSSSSICSKDDVDLRQQQHHHSIALEMQIQPQNNGGNINRHAANSLLSIDEHEELKQIQEKAHTGGQSSSQQQRSSSLPQSERSTNQDSTLCNHKDTVKLKDRIQIFKSLRHQLKQLIQDLNNNYNSNPFKVSPSTYVDKTLGLLRIIQEIEKNTNMLNIKSEFDNYKSKIERLHQKTQLLDYELHHTKMQHQDALSQNQKLSEELREMKEQLNHEHGQVELMIKLSEDQKKRHQETLEEKQNAIKQLGLQVEQEQAKQEEIRMQLNKQIELNTIGNLNLKGIKDQEKLMQLKQEYGKKLADQTVDYNDLKEYVKERSIEFEQIRLQEKRIQEEQVRRLKEQEEVMKKNYERIIKEKDNELRMMQEIIQGLDPEYFSKNQSIEKQNQDWECPDCKKKEAKLAAATDRNRELTEYIKKNPDRLGNEKKKQYEDLIAKLSLELQDAQNRIVKLDCEKKNSVPVSSTLSKQVLEKMQVLFEGLSKLIELDQCTQGLKEQFNQIKISGDPNPLSQENKNNFREILFSFLASLKESSLVEPNQQEQLHLPINKNNLQKDLLDKMGFTQEIAIQQKEAAKKSLNLRKLCHQKVIEVEKMMYEMNKLLITEQTNLEDQQASIDKIPLSIQLYQTQLEKRTQMTQHQIELFKRILAGFLELPHKLKDIFERQKQQESLLSKAYKADPSVLYDLTAEIIGAINQRGGEIRMQEMQMQLGMLDSQRNHLAEENERYRNKNIKLLEDLTMLQSQQQALKNHLGSKQQHSMSRQFYQRSLQGEEGNQMRMSQTSLLSDSSSSSADHHLMSRQGIQEFNNSSMQQSIVGQKDLTGMQSFNAKNM